MTEARLEQRVDQLEDLMAELARVSARAGREVERTSREMREFKDENREFWEQSRRERIAWRRQWGELSNKMGTMAEDLVAPSMGRILRTVIGCPEDHIDSVAVRVRRRSTVDRGRMQEFDVVAVCGEHALVNETKSLLMPEHLAAFLEHLATVRDYFPRVPGQEGHWRHRVPLRGREPGPGRRKAGAGRARLRRGRDGRAQLPRLRAADVLNPAAAGMVHGGIRAAWQFGAESGSIGGISFDSSGKPWLNRHMGHSSVASASRKRRGGPCDDKPTPAKDWDDLAWRQFVRWRITSITRFVEDVFGAAREVDPDLVLFTENWGMDSNFVTPYAQDPLELVDNPYVATAHELEPVDQDEAGMANATLKQWRDYALMVKFGVAANKGKPGWILTYAGSVDDSLREAGVHLAEGANFYEAKGPEMVDDSTGSRQIVFSWLASNTGMVYHSTPLAEVAMWYSPRSRDFLDGEDAGEDKFDYADTTYYQGIPGARAEDLLKAQLDLVQNRLRASQRLRRETAPSENM